MAMATLASPSSSPTISPLRRQTKSCARKCERACCAVATYFPLAFVYSLTTWAVYVEAEVGFQASPSGARRSWPGKPSSFLGILLYILLNTSYTVAIFTDPGSPLQSRTSSTGTGKYFSLPTSETSNSRTPDNVQSITVSSSGAPRFCKKCHTHKPDRTHHCSTCRRCVLKMDHHCPWLATCLGLHNYKAFVLFLIYTSLFSWVCFLGTALWVWSEVLHDNVYLEDFAPVNVILLAVISGIIGIVITGFTAWHLYLCMRGQTTIECLEKTRYLGAVRRQVERQRLENMHRDGRSQSPLGVTETLQRAGEQILEFHANAVPGATRLEEGEERQSPASSIHPGTRYTPMHPIHERPEATPAEQALQRSYSSLEQQREWERYEEYIDDRESEQLPNAFDLGWRRNLAHVFGPHPLLWALPVCNSPGDGWRWEVSPKWVQATEELAARRHVDPYQSQEEGGTIGYKNASSLRGGAGGADYETGLGHDLESGYEHESGSGSRSRLSPYYDDHKHNINTRGSVRSGLSMHTLKQRPQASPPGATSWVNQLRGTKPQQRRDFDQAEEDGEVDQFEVSSNGSIEELGEPPSSWRNGSAASESGEVIPANRQTHPKEQHQQHRQNDWKDNWD